MQSGITHADIVVVGMADSSQRRSMTICLSKADKSLHVHPNTSRSRAQIDKERKEFKELASRSIIIGLLETKTSQNEATSRTSNQELFLHHHSPHDQLRKGKDNHRNTERHDEGSL